MSNVDLASAVKASIEARARARELVELAGEEHPRFWEELRDLAAARMNKSTGLEPMSDSEALAFEKKPMLFGKHAGSLIGDVPLEYFDWLVGARESDRFALDLVRYVRSVRCEWRRASA